MKRIKREDFVNTYYPSGWYRWAVQSPMGVSLSNKVILSISYGKKLKEYFSILSRYWEN